MPFQRGLSPHPPVALLAEGVDRNSFNIPQIPQLATVALLAEGVDRNLAGERQGKLALVALLAEGVDRNDQLHGVVVNGLGRPPRGGRG